MEQQAAENYASLSAQGGVSAPLPHPVESVSVPLGKYPTIDVYFNEGLGKENLKGASDILILLPLVLLSQLEAYDQDEIIGEPEEDLENGNGTDQDLYSGDLQTFDNGPAFHQQFRRKSIIPVDETVLDELSRHRSLEEVLDMKRSSGNNDQE